MLWRMNFPAISHEGKKSACIYEAQLNVMDALQQKVKSLIFMRWQPSPIHIVQIQSDNIVLLSFYVPFIISPPLESKESSSASSCRKKTFFNVTIVISVENTAI